MPPGEVDYCAHSQATKGEGGSSAPYPAGHTPLWHDHQIVDLDVCIPVLSYSLHSLSLLSVPALRQPSCPKEHLTPELGPLLTYQDEHEPLKTWKPARTSKFLEKSSPLSSYPCAN